jgi:hypothetical protein
MNRTQREARKRIEALGLTIVSVKFGKKHLHIRIRNKDGQESVRVISTGTRLGPRDAANEKAELKRFARGVPGGLGDRKPA